METTKKKYLISVSLICGDLVNLSSSINKIVSYGADLIHMDIMDNCFVNGFGFSPQFIHQVRSICDLPIDIHLMTVPTEELISELSFSVGNRIIIHSEIENLENCVKMVLDSGSELGLALKPQTPVDILLPHIMHATTVLVFTVNPGKRGQPIREDALIRVSSVKKFLNKHHPLCDLQVDGGVYCESIRGLYNAGATTFVLGSAFFGKDGHSDPNKLMQPLLKQLD